MLTTIPLGGAPEYAALDIPAKLLYQNITIPTA